MMLLPHAAPRAVRSAHKPVLQREQYARTSLHVPLASSHARVATHTHMWGTLRSPHSPHILRARMQ